MLPEKECVICPHLVDWMTEAEAFHSQGSCVREKRRAKASSAFTNFTLSKRLQGARHPVRHRRRWTGSVWGRD